MFNSTNSIGESITDPLPNIKTHRTNVSKSTTPIIPSTFKSNKSTQTEISLNETQSVKRKTQDVRQGKSQRKSQDVSQGESQDVKSGSQDMNDNSIITLRNGDFRGINYNTKRINRSISKLVGRNNSGIYNNSGMYDNFDADVQSKLVRNFIESRGIVHDQIKAYEDTLENQIPQIIARRVIRINDDSHIAFTNPHYSLPSIEDPHGRNRVMFPQMARDEHRTYSTTLYIDLEHRRNETGELVHNSSASSIRQNIKIAEIPVMVGSNKDNIMVHKLDRNPLSLLKMGECPYDPRGYFIIRGGVEKVILVQEGLRAMLPIITKIKKEFVCLITCLTVIGSIIVRLSYNQKCRSINIFLHIFQGRDTNIPVYHIFRILGMSDMKEITDYILQFVRDDIKNKVRMELQGSMANSAAVSDVYGSVYSNSIYVSNKKKPILEGMEMVQYVYNSVRDALFPHIGSKSPQNVEEYNAIIESKKMLLALMVARYAEFLTGVREADNRDSWINKRLILGGPKIKQLFRTLFDRMVDNIENNIFDYTNEKQRTLESVARNISSTLITDEMENSFRSDQWGPSKRTRSANVTEHRDRGEALIASHDQILRINTPTNRQATQSNVRSIQADQQGFIDPVATPSSDACGLVKNKALGCEVSIERDDFIIDEYINMSNMIVTSKDNQHRDICILNARPLGWCDGKALRLELLRRRRAGEIYADTALIYNVNDREFSIDTGGGRVIKPLIIIGTEDDGEWNGVPFIFKPGMSKLSFDQLCREGVIEWIDVREAMNHYAVSPSIKHSKELIEDRKRIEHILSTLRSKYNQVKNINSVDRNTLIQSDLKRKIAQIELSLTRLKRKVYTHVDIDPVLSLGVAAANIPWLNSNQGPRNAFQASMSRQAIGQNHSNFSLHFPTTGKYLTYATRPLAGTQMQTTLGLDNLPAGHNVILAICTDEKNEEDAVVIKKEALDRGLLNYKVVHSYSTIVQNPRKMSNGDIIEQLTTNGLPFQRHDINDYRHIDTNGVIAVGSVVKPGDCLICKVKIVKSTTKGANSKVKVIRRDASIYVDPWESGVVDYVKITNNSNGEKIIRVRISRNGKPTIGDKVATRQAQKSIIGKIVPEIDLPYTETGITPDILINPHALPKRMTVATYIEIVTGKYAAMSGTRIDATPFRDFQLETYRTILQDVYGFDSSGEETLYLFSGKKILNCKLMMGPTYYQLLRHQVDNKNQYRGQGIRKLVTRLPPQGRKKNGAIRFSEQETHAMLAHSAVHMLRDRTLLTCDGHKVVICMKCNNQAIIDMSRDIIICQSCNSSEFGVSTQAYTHMLMTHYCATAGIHIKSEYTDPNKPNNNNNKEVEYYAGSSSSSFSSSTSKQSIIHDQNDESDQDMLDDDELAEHGEQTSDEEEAEEVEEEEEDYIIDD